MEIFFYLIAAIIITLFIVKLIKYFKEKKQTRPIWNKPIDTSPQVPPPVDLVKYETIFCMGGTNPSWENAFTAKEKYTTTRRYDVRYPIGELPLIQVGYKIYDSYPTKLTKGDYKWVGITVDGKGTVFAVQVDNNGNITQVL